MFPTIFEIGSFRLSTYGLMMMLAFVSGIFMAVRRGKPRGIDSTFIQDLSTIILVCSLLGARMAYVVTHLSEFQGNWLAIINPVNSNGSFGIAGLVLLGGVITAIPITIFYTRKKNYDVLEVLDLLAPSLALGIIFGRFGCLMNGCCYGNACDLPWAINYPVESFLHGHSLHPTQVYSMLANLLIMFALLGFSKGNPKKGQVMALFLILYSPARFVIEFLRDYEASMILTRIGNWQVTTSQMLTFSMFITGLVLFYAVSRTNVDHQESQTSKTNPDD
jgi:phosphatidylglycerol---prolipoprotein diacylglyceryl transferase